MSVLCCLELGGMRGRRPHHPPRVVAFGDALHHRTWHRCSDAALLLPPPSSPPFSSSSSYSSSPSSCCASPQIASRLVLLAVLCRASCGGHSLAERALVAVSHGHPHPRGRRCGPRCGQGEARRRQHRRHCHACTERAEPRRSRGASACMCMRLPRRFLSLSSLLFSSPHFSRSPSLSSVLCFSIISPRFPFTPHSRTLSIYLSACVVSVCHLVIASGTLLWQVQGSERVLKTEVSGLRLKEAQSINKCVTAGVCVIQLTVTSAWCVVAQVAVSARRRNLRAQDGVVARSIPQLQADFPAEGLAGRRRQGDLRAHVHVHVSLFIVGCVLCALSLSLALKI
jgi:hypothetical protein